MKNKSIKFLFFLSLLLMLLAPILTLAAGLVPTCSTDPVTQQCNWGWYELMTLITNVVRFVLFDMALPISAIMFAYAGFLLVTSGGSTEQKSKAKRIFTSVAWGLIVAVAAWLIIHTILSILGYDGDWIGF